MLLFQKQAGNNGKLIGIFWDDSEMLQSVIKDKNRTFESRLCCSLLSRHEVNFIVHTSALLHQNFTKLFLRRQKDNLSFFKE